MRESEIETETCKAGKLEGWRHYKFVSPGLRGVPDHFFTKHPRRVKFVEFKDPDAAAREKPRTQQLKRQKELRDQGFEVYEVSSIEEGRAIFQPQ